MSTLNPTASVAKRLPYRVRDDFLSPAERSFFGVLQRSVNGRAVVFAKVRVADLIYVRRGEGKTRHQNRINSKHIDFVLCSLDSVRPLAAIELDDSSHQRKDRIVRDDFLESVFEAAELPLIRFPVRRQYDIREVSEQIDVVLSRAHVSTTLREPVMDSAGPPDCPKCGSPMIRRTAASGSNKGSRFFGCRNFPNCREIVPIVPGQ